MNREKINVEIDLRHGVDLREVGWERLQSGAIQFRTPDGAIAAVREHRRKVEALWVVHFRILLGAILISIPMTPQILFEPKDWRTAADVIGENFRNCMIDILRGRMHVQECGYREEADSPIYEECFTQDGGLMRICRGAGARQAEFCDHCTKRRRS